MVKDGASYRSYRTYGSYRTYRRKRHRLTDVVNNSLRERAAARPILVRVRRELPGDVIRHVELLPRPRVGDLLAFRERLFHCLVHQLRGLEPLQVFEE